MTLPAKRLKYIETLTYAKFKPNYIDSDGVAIQGNHKNVTLVSNEKKEFKERCQLSNKVSEPKFSPNYQDRDTKTDVNF